MKFIFIYQILTLQSDIRDLIDAHINIETTWNKQEKKIILKIAERVTEIYY